MAPKANLPIRSFAEKMPGGHKIGQQVALSLACADTADGAVAADHASLAAVQAWILSSLKPSRYILAATGGSTVELWAVCSKAKRCDNLRAALTTALPAFRVISVAVSDEQDDLARAASVNRRAVSADLCWLRGYDAADLTLLPTTARPQLIHISQGKSFEVLTTHFDWAVILGLTVPHGGTWQIPLALCADCPECLAFRESQWDWNNNVKLALRHALTKGYDSSALYSERVRSQLAGVLADWWDVVVCGGTSYVEGPPAPTRRRHLTDDEWD